MGCSSSWCGFDLGTFMLICLPWLFTSRRLLLDCRLFALLFTGWFQLRFGSWPSFSLPLSWPLQFWLLCS
jgi:hypothetical protein